MLNTNFNRNTCTPGHSDKECGLSDYECGIIAVARWVVLSISAADFLGFSHPIGEFPQNDQIMQ